VNVTSLHQIGANASSDIIVYPNPGNGMFQLLFGNKFDSEINWDVAIFNVVGQSVYTGQLNKERRITTDLNSGFYVLRLTSGDKVLTNSFLISR
jgi:hypothetical protein